jgi:Fe-S-cluster containining protein
MSAIVNPDKLFACRQCGDCCRGYGGTFVTPKEIEAVSAYLNLDSTRFVGEFCRMSGGKPVLAQGKDDYCIFWDGLCTIHPVKPLMCKRWPFIESVLIDVHNWHVMASCCPGIRTDASDQMIRASVRAVLSKTG